MSWFPRPAAPATVFRDLRAFIGTRQRHQFVFAAIAVSMPVILVAAFLHDTKREPPEPIITYITQFAPDRTDAEIIAQRDADKKKLDDAREKRRMEWVRVKDRLGM